MNTSAPPRRPSLVIYLADLSGGGTERLYLGLAPAFVAGGYDVTILLDRRQGKLLAEVPNGITVAVLGASRQIMALPRLVAFLRRARPSLLLTAMEHMSVLAVLARALACVRTKVVITQHNALSEQAKRPGRKNAVLPGLFRWALPRAGAVAAVSQGVADEMASLAGFPRDHIAVLYNGAIRSDFDIAATAPLATAWPQAGPVILAVGRLVPQKDHATLVRAAARLAAGGRPVDLVLLGEGPLRPEIEALAAELGIADRLFLPGFIANPLPCMRRADVVVLSSRFEGFGLVLTEALACGTRVVSTDCPHGPGEILEGGLHGRLAPVGDPEGLAQAIAASLDGPAPSNDGVRRGRGFSVERCAADYLAWFDAALGRSRNGETSDRSSRAAHARDAA